MIGKLVRQGPPLFLGHRILFVMTNIGAVGTCAFRTRWYAGGHRNHEIRLTIVHEFLLANTSSLVNNFAVARLRNSACERVFWWTIKLVF